MKKKHSSFVTNYKADWSSSKCGEN